LASALVYSSQTTDVKDVVIDGAVVLRERKFTASNEETILADAVSEQRVLMQRAGVKL
jgi:hypothetical protein